jgi:hypothetical protein
VIAVEVVAAPNDKQQIATMLNKIDALPEHLGRPETLFGRQWLFQRGQCDAVRGSEHRAAYCARPSTGRKFGLARARPARIDGAIAPQHVDEAQRWVSG